MRDPLGRIPERRQKQEQPGVMSAGSQTLTRYEKYAFTAAMYACMLAMGTTSSMISPARRDIADNVSSDFSHLSYGSSASAIGSACGSIVYAVIYARANRQLCLVTTLALVSVIFFSMSIIRSLWSLIGLQVLYGTFNSGIDVACNAWLLQVWQTAANPFMQAMHTCFGIGAAIGPLIVEPFLSPEPGNSTTNVTSIGEAGGEEHVNHIPIPFSIASLTYAGTAVYTLFLYFRIPYTEVRRSVSAPKAGNSTGREKYEDNNNSQTSEQSPLETRALDKRYYVPLIVLSCLLMCFYNAIELSTLGFLSEFVQDIDLHLSKGTAAYMQSVMSTAYAVNRGISVFIAMKVKPQSMILISFAMLAVGNVLLISFANHSETMIWVSIVMMGAGHSCVFPAIMSHVEERLNVTTTVSAAFILSATIAYSIVAVISGLLLQSHPLTYVIINLVGLSVCAVLFAAMQFLELRFQRSDSDLLRLN